jgi:competence protein CoiA
MKFALVDGQRQEAQPNLKGVCVGCGSPTLARCGEIRVNHWAHQGKRLCDPWWESETEWHRAWKNQFPSEWQEIIHYADDGEKHISDVKTDHGWFLEFQHSQIKPEERRSREDFYQKLIWVVDGKRRVRDEKQFHEAVRQSRGNWIDNNKYPELHSLLQPEGALFRDWITSTSYVFFDFGGDDLWGLLPQSNDDWALILPITRRQFIEFHTNGLASGENRFEIFFKNYDIKPPEKLSTPPKTPMSNVGGIHPNTILRLMNNRRRFRL